jgi:hypothetical protein
MYNCIRVYDKLLVIEGEMMRKNGEGVAGIVESLNKCATLLTVECSWHK